MGLFEILLIAVVTLLVVGPERMPEAVRSVALTIGRVKRFFNNARQEIEKQVGADDIRQQLHNEAVMEQIAKTEQDSANTNADANTDINTEEPDTHSILGDKPRSSLWEWTLVTYEQPCFYFSAFRWALNWIT